MIGEYGGAAVPGAHDAGRPPGCVPGRGATTPPGAVEGDPQTDPALDPVFLARPIAHRGLHGPGRAENSLAAVVAAADAGYGVEIDVQPTADGQAAVFHDHLLDRVTGRGGPVRQRTAAELESIPLKGGGGTIPMLPAVLEAVAGRAPLLVEIKDRDGSLGADVGPLERAVAAAVSGHDGPLAVMSFNPHSVALMAHLAPDVARGLTTCAFRKEDWPGVPDDTLAHLRAVPDIFRVGASFVSHRADDLGSPHVARIKAAGLPILCWTTRSPEEDASARRVADNVTFEGYAA